MMSVRASQGLRRNTYNKAPDFYLTGSGSKHIGSALPGMVKELQP
jgi:hypothetical protein